MILIPELETVVILVPRTGSGTLRRAISAAYPRSMLVYRHMEADGVPQGYDRWRKIGFVREPIDRRWSLYKFLTEFAGPQHDPAYVDALHRSVDRSFSEWVVDNETVFTSPYDRAGKGRFWPEFACRHPMPENTKSQFMYLRPDLGTSVYPYRDLQAVALRRLGIDLEVAPMANRTARSASPELTPEALDHIERFFAWDIEAFARGGPGDD